VNDRRWRVKILGQRQARRTLWLKPRHLESLKKIRKGVEVLLLDHKLLVADELLDPGLADDRLMAPQLASEMAFIDERVAVTTRTRLPAPWNRGLPKRHGAIVRR
jgi:hypothetical protein